jgi:DNA adenine methylase
MRLRRAKSTYYRVRSENPSELAPDQRAARFIYLNGLCFNGLYRVNMQGRFNVPFGSKHREVLFTPDGLRQASYALRRADIRHSDFEPVVDRTREGDFIYLDPPYATGSRRTFLEYGQRVFSSEDLKRLLGALGRADKRGARFLISYADVPEIRNVPRRWHIKHVRTRRNIAGFLSSRRTVSEVLVSNVR